MKYVQYWLLFCCAALANPIIVYDDVREVQMTHEDVVLDVSVHTTAVSGDYTFAQLAATTPKDEFVRILVPVYVQKDADLKLADMKRIYTPRLIVSGTSYDATDVSYGGDRWKSWWRGAEFHLAAFEFVVPRRVLAQQFHLRIEYQQPHMLARGERYTCYCPFRPHIKNPAYRDVPDGEFTLRVVPSSGVKIKRVSTNQKVQSEGSAGIVIHCLHREHIIVKVENA